jgi:hypothetical protein
MQSLDRRLSPAQLGSQHFDRFVKKHTETIEAHVLRLFARTIRGSFLIIFPREKGSAPLVRIPSLWAESGPSLRCLYLAIWKDEKNSFAQLEFLFSRAWEFQQQ